MKKNFKFLLKTFLKKHWQKIGIKKRAGVIFPLFSAYSKNSIGIGEIPDLKLLIDWCEITGNTILQILPINDTGFDFSPYNSQSSFALDPVYLSLRSLIEIKRGNLEKELEDLAKKFLIKTKFVNWQIKGEKLKKLWLIFLKQARFPLRFQKFIKKNNYWLEDYCLFEVLKEIHRERPWEDWPQPFKNRNQKALLEFKKKYRQKIKFQKWLQWQLFEQLNKVKNYARKKKIFLKGDLPFLISRDSADVWKNRQYFKLNLATGAPPDLFSIKGQRWGYPPYNWEEILRDNFLYFRQRLKYAQNFYDLFRIDHLVGLFRIWSIPVEVPFNKQGTVGFFDPKNEKIWEEKGRKILRLMAKSTTMLSCAEDLGTVPHFCQDVLGEFGIPGLDIQRWKKNWQNFEFLRPKEYRPMSVATLSTHDLNDFPVWWEEETGSIPKEFFKMKCRERKINFERVKNKLFLEKFGRLFWRKIDKRDLIKILNRPEKEIQDLIKIYQNTYREKEKFWKLVFKKAPFSKKANKRLIKKNLELINSSASIFVILLIFEWLFLGNILKGRPSQYRINIPGKVSKTNWSLRIPISLEELKDLSINQGIRKIIQNSGRI